MHPLIMIPGRARSLCRVYSHHTVAPSDLHEFGQAPIDCQAKLVVDT